MATLERVSFSDLLARRSDEVHEVAVPSVEYFARGDFLTVFFEDELYYSERIDDLLTVYRSMKSNVLIGCKIKGVSLIAKNVVNMIDVEDDEFSLSLLLLNAAGPHAAKQFYFDVSQKARTLKLKVSASQILSHAA